jgi:hypothetical protein
MAENIEIEKNPVEILYLGEDKQSFLVVDREDNLKVYADIDFQDGPRKEVGVNGCRCEDLLDICLFRLEYFQSMEHGKWACEENKQAIQLIRGALEFLNVRTRKRVARRIEGLSIVG